MRDDTDHPVEERLPKSIMEGRIYAERQRLGTTASQSGHVVAVAWHTERRDDERAHPSLAFEPLGFIWGIFGGWGGWGRHVLPTSGPGTGDVQLQGRCQQHFQWETQVFYLKISLLDM